MPQGDDSRPRSDVTSHQGSLSSQQGVNFLYANKATQKSRDEGTSLPKHVTLDCAFHSENHGNSRFWPACDMQPSFCGARCSGAVRKWRPPTAGISCVAPEGQVAAGNAGPPALCSPGSEGTPEFPRGAPRERREGVCMLGASEPVPCLPGTPNRTEAQQG